MYEQGRVISPSFAEGCGLEWLVTNGIGGYASSTAVGANTRSYHGLLVAAVDPPADRRLLLSSLDEEVIGEQSFQLANHQYPGVVHPQGFAHLQELILDPFPRFTYRLGGAEVEKTVFMLPGENSTLVCYRLRGQGSMIVRPLVHCRSFHFVSPLPAMSTEQVDGGVRIRSDCSFYLLSDGASFVPQELWFYNLQYEVEHRRGLGWTEDCYSPGYFQLDWTGKESFVIMASTTRSSMPEASACRECEQDRIFSLQAPIPRMALVADSFQVKRGPGRSILAGYHWFNDWGRDAMISLPGLLLSTGRFSEAKQVLRTFARAMKDGIMPNDLGACSYNTVDASLWFVQALYQYYNLTGDREILEELWPALCEIVQAYNRGTAVARMDEDGLIVSQGGMTWMDARVDGRPVTPRAGKCCEINALWYSLLRALSLFAAELGEGWDEGPGRRVKKSYRRFWNDEARCLYDVIDPHDPSIRPNQVIAAAVSFDLLTGRQRKMILEVAHKKLLTPYGLRTLSPDDARYLGRYEGGPVQRDSAYHQGTVWPWLMGPYLSLLMRVNRYTKKSAREVQEQLMPLLKETRGGMGTVAEVYDGDLPQRPGGCISQAWSVAEVLRAWGEAERVLTGPVNPQQA